MKSIVIPAPIDFHLHLRRGDVLKNVLPQTLRWCRTALVMPNTDPPILTVEDAFAYEKEILETASPIPFYPLMALMLTDETEPQQIEEATFADITAMKLYPRGVTTGSHHGVSDIHLLWPVFKAMEDCDVVLSIHGEHPDTSPMDAELTFLLMVEQIAEAFPKLRIVLEHISTAKAVELIQTLPDTVAATITPHHLVLTHADAESNPHCFCKPIPKTSFDRDALIEAATGGNPKFFFGSDSAPHLREHKECFRSAPGIFNAPIALPILTEVFAKQDKLYRLADFTSRFGSRFYRIPPPPSPLKLRLTQQPTFVPNEIKGIVPLFHGKMLDWRIDSCVPN